MIALRRGVGVSVSLALYVTTLALNMTCILHHFLTQARTWTCSRRPTTVCCYGWARQMIHGARVTIYHSKFPEHPATCQRIPSLANTYSRAHSKVNPLRYPSLGRLSLAALVTFVALITRKLNCNIDIVLYGQDSSQVEILLNPTTITSSARIYIADHHC